MMQQPQHFRQRVKRGNFRSLFGPAGAPARHLRRWDGRPGIHAEEPSSPAVSYPN